MSNGFDASRQPEQKWCEISNASVEFMMILFFLFFLVPMYFSINATHIKAFAIWNVRSCSLWIFIFMRISIERSLVLTMFSQFKFLQVKWKGIIYGYEKLRLWIIIIICLLELKDRNHSINSSTFCRLHSLFIIRNSCFFSLHLFFYKNNNNLDPYARWSGHW